MQYLLTSNEQIRLQVTAAIAEAEGLGEVVATDSFDRLREALSTGDVSCVLVDEALADVSAMSAVQEISQAHPLLPVVLLTRAEAPRSSRPPWTRVRAPCSRCRSPWRS